jgi:uncharacterized protein
MILENEIDLPAGPDEVFALLNDVERIAGCLPGARLEGSDGDSYRGSVKLKVGPITVGYAGTIRFTEVAVDERRMRVSARGTDTHGAGDAAADVTIVVAPSGAGSSIQLHTDLSIRGKVAQFGKGAIESVSNRLMDQFAANIVALLEVPAATHAAIVAPAAVTAAAAYPEAAVARPTGPTGAHDGLAILLPPGVRRWAPMAAAAALGLLHGWLLSRLRAQRAEIRQLRRGQG